MNSANPYAKALAKLNKNKLGKQSKRPKLEKHQFTLSRSAFKALCRGAGRYNLPVSVYLELLSMQSELMEAMAREA